MGLFKVIIYFLLFSILSATSANANLIVLTNIEPPTTFAHNGKLVGTSYDIVCELLKRVNLDTPILVQPWARAYKTAQKNPNVLLFTAAKTKDRIDQGFLFLGPIFTRKHAIYKKKDSNIIVANAEDIKRQRLVVGGLRKDWRVEYFENEGVCVDKANSHKQSLSKMLAGRFSLLIGSDIEIPYWLKNLNYPLDYFEVAFEFKEAPSFIMFSKGTDPDMIKRMEAAFQNMQNDHFFDSIAKVYSERLGYRLDYLSSKGLFRP